MSRGGLGITFRVGQDFAGEMEGLLQVVGTEIEWELDVALPEIEGALKAAGRQDDLKTAGHVAAHTPTNFDPDGPRWGRGHPSCPD